MKEIIEMPQRESAGIVSAGVHRFSAVEIRQRVNLVQEVMHGIMKKDTHYGTIPGTPKPTLYKPGAEVLCVTFRVAQEYRVEDLSTGDIARYRVTCVGRHQTTGIVLGEGLGECSSGEEKYKWRGAICTEEFNLTPENMRRVKFYKNGNKANQVRTEAADLSNTVLKMACKRAMIAMTLNVTAASDIFTQDIEDIPEELRPDPEPSAPAISALSIRLSDEVKAVKSRADFDDLWTRGCKEIRAAGDTAAWEVFKAEMEAKSKEYPKVAAKQETPREPGSDDDLNEDFQRQIERETGK